MSSTSKTEFGHGMRQHFLFEEDWVNLNHGCFGTYPKQVAEVRFEIIKTVERKPDLFLRYDHLPLLKESCRRLAEYLHVPTDEIVLVANATLAITTVLRNLTFGERDVIIFFESVYDAVEMTLMSMQETNPHIHLHKVDYGNDSAKPEYPKDHDGICESFRQAIARLHKDGYNVKVAVFETISSVPALRLPFERLTKLCRDQGILSLIDGAHGIGQIPLNLGELDADFFISNCHKWLYVPRGCAVFHVPKRNQRLIRTAFPTSWEFELQSSGTDTSDRFQNQFQMQATADNSPFYCIPAALDMREKICGGEMAIFQYSKEVAQKGADLIAKKLGTVVMQEPAGDTQNRDIDSTTFHQYAGLRDCAMCNVLLPLMVEDATASGTNPITSNNAGEVTGWMQRVLPADYNTSVSFFVYRRQIWVRLNGQIYLELSDFEWFASALLDVCKRVEAGEPFKDRIL